MNAASSEYPGPCTLPDDIWCLIVSIYEDCRSAARTNFGHESVRTTRKTSGSTRAPSRCRRAMAAASSGIVAIASAAKTAAVQPFWFLKNRQRLAQFIADDIPAGFRNDCLNRLGDRPTTLAKAREKCGNSE